MDVVIFSSLLTQSFVSQLEADYPQISTPVGECVPFLSQNDACPAPSVAPTLWCQSRTQM